MANGRWRPLSRDPGVLLIIVGVGVLGVVCAQPVQESPPTPPPVKVEKGAVDPAVGLVLNSKTRKPMTPLECALPGCGISWKDWEEQNPVLNNQHPSLRGSPGVPAPSPRADFGKYMDEPVHDEAKEDIDDVINETGTKAPGPGEGAQREMPKKKSPDVEEAAVEGESDAAMSDMEKSFNNMSKDLESGPDARPKQPDDAAPVDSGTDQVAKDAGVAAGGGGGAVKSSEAVEADRAQEQKVEDAQGEAQMQKDAQEASGEIISTDGSPSGQEALLEVSEGSAPDVQDAMAELDEFDQLDTHIVSDLNTYPSDAPSAKPPQDMSLDEDVQEIDDGSDLPGEGSPGLENAVPPSVGGNDLDAHSAETPMVGSTDDISDQQMEHAMELAEAQNPAAAKAAAPAPAPAPASPPAPAQGQPAPPAAQQGAPVIKQGGSSPIQVSFSGGSKPHGLDVKVGQHDTSTPMVSIGIGTPAHPPPHAPVKKPPVQKPTLVQTTQPTKGEVKDDNPYPFPYPGDGLPPLRLNHKPKAKLTPPPKKKKCHPKRCGFLPAHVEGMTGSAKVLLLPRMDGMPYGSPPGGKVPGDVPKDIPPLKDMNYRRPFTSKSLGEQGLDGIAVSSKEEFQRLTDISEGKVEAPFSGGSDEWENDHEMFTNVDPSSNCFDYCKVACKPSEENCKQNNCHRICVEGDKGRVNKMLVRHGVIAPSAGQLPPTEQAQVAKLMHQLPRFNEKVSLSKIPATLTNRVMRKLENKLRFQRKRAKASMRELIHKKSASPDELKALVFKQQELQELTKDLDRMRKAAVNQAIQHIKGKGAVKKRMMARRRFARMLKNKKIHAMTRHHADGDVDVDDSALQDMVKDGQNAYQKALNEAASVMDASKGGPLAGVFSSGKGVADKGKGDISFEEKKDGKDEEADQFQSHMDHKWNLQAHAMDACPGGCTGTHGTCVRGVCECKDQWYGDDCSQTKEEHDDVKKELEETDSCPFACNGRGTCLPTKKCLCEEGRYGDACQFDHPPTGEEVAKDSGDDDDSDGATKTAGIATTKADGGSSRSGAHAGSTHEKNSKKEPSGVVSTEVIRSVKVNEVGKVIPKRPVASIFAENDAADPPPRLSGTDTTVTPVAANSNGGSTSSGAGDQTPSPSSTLADYPDAGPINVAVDKGLSDAESYLRKPEIKKEFEFHTNAPIKEPKKCYVLCVPNADVSDCRRMCVSENTPFPNPV